MYCANCGAKLNERDEFCSNCGTKREISKNTIEANNLNQKICPNCRSNNVSIKLVNESYLKNAHHGVLWWIIIGWWWIFVKWLVFTIPALIFKIFGIGKKKKIVNKQKKVYVCQNCGKTF